MRHTEFRTIQVTSAGLVEAIGEVLNVLLVEEGRAGEATYLLGFDAEAPTPEAATRDALQEILDLADEHQAGIRGCEIAGLRNTDGGYRLWGTIECAAGQGSTRVDADTVGSIRIEEGADDTWTISMRGGEA